MVRILFVCGKARKRSPTAADLAARHEGVESDFGGLGADADERLSSEQISWADIVVVMERAQLSRLKRQFGPELRGKRVACLNVPDRFEYMEPALVRRLEPDLRRLLRLPD